MPVPFHCCLLLFTAMAHGGWGEKFIWRCVCVCLCVCVCVCVQWGTQSLVQCTTGKRDKVAKFSSQLLEIYAVVIIYTPSNKFSAFYYFFLLLKPSGASFFKPDRNTLCRTFAFSFYAIKFLGHRTQNQSYNSLTCIAFDFWIF